MLSLLQAYECLAHVWHGRFRPGADQSGLNDPFVRVVFGPHSARTQVRADGAQRRAGQGSEGNRSEGHRSRGSGLSRSIKNRAAIKNRE